MRNLGYVGYVFFSALIGCGTNVDSLFGAGGGGGGGDDSWGVTSGNSTASSTSGSGGSGGSGGMTNSSTGSAGAGGFGGTGSTGTSSSTSTSTSTSTTGGGEVCGNGVCAGIETPANCEDDCGPACGNGICSFGETCDTCVTDCCAHCADNSKNGNETGVDCGGPDCAPCTIDQPCVTNSDCDAGQNLWCCTSFDNMNNPVHKCDNPACTKTNMGGCPAGSQMYQCNVSGYNPLSDPFLCFEFGDPQNKNWCCYPQQ